MDFTETDLDVSLVSIQQLGIRARETIKNLADAASPLLIVEAANILEDVERLESAYLGELFLRELEVEFANKGKSDAV